MHIGSRRQLEKYLSQVEFAYNNSYQSTIGIPPFEALYGRRCRSLICWEEVGDQKLLGPDLVQDMTEKILMIRKRMRAAQSRQKSYADQRRRPLEFAEEDKVFLKVSPIRGMVQTEGKNKLGPQYIGSFDILEKDGRLA